MTDLILNNEKVKLFREKYEPELIKPFTVELFDKGLGFGVLEEKETHFVIHLCETVPIEAQYANFCHEFFHAVQVSRGTPDFIASASTAPIEDEFFINLRSMIFDMGVNDALNEEGIDSTYFFDHRMRTLQSLCDRNFDKVVDQFYKDFLAVNLTLAYSHALDKDSKSIRKRVDKALPDVSQMVKDLQEIIHNNGYKTPNQIFLSLGRIFNYLDLWKIKWISYQGIIYKTQIRFDKFACANVG